MEYIEDFEGRDMTKNVIPEEDIALCLYALKCSTKDAILEGLRELEILINKINILDQENILDTIEGLLDKEDTDIKKGLLNIIEKMIRRAGRERGEDSEDRKKLIEKYNQKILDIVKEEDIKIRSIAIEVLIEMNDDNFIKPLTNIILDENIIIENFNFPFSTMRMINKRKLKRELLRKLDENTVLSDPIKQRMSKILEQTRRDYS